MTPDAPFRERLDRLLAADPRDVCGLLAEYGPPPRAAPGETVGRVSAVFRATGAAMAGEGPAERRDHAPPWVGPALRGHLVGLAGRWAPPGTFVTIRALERLGIVHLEPDHHYVLAFVAHLDYRLGDDHVSRAEFLRADPELMERCFWPMFTVEGDGEAGLATIDRRARNPWRADVLDLVSDGTASRDRALDRCLDALDGRLGPAEASWFTGMFAALYPGADQLADRQPRLVGLLGSPVEPTVSFAVRQLVAVEAAGLLDNEAAADELGPALRSRTRITALGGLRLLAAAARRRPDLAPAIAAAVEPGLTHPQPDIRDRAAALLARVAPDDSPATVDAPSSAATTPTVPTTTDPPPTALPHLGPLDLDDLPGTAADLLADAADPASVERMLDALIRLDEPARLRDTAVRARALVGRAGTEGRGYRLESRLARLVLAAVDGPADPDSADSAGAAAPSPADRGPFDHDPAAESPVFAEAPLPVPFLDGRLDEIAAALRTGVPRTGMLALPTTWPWIAPAVLVDRLIEAARAGLRPLHHDLVAALLRLHPDSRPQALARWEAAVSPATAAASTPPGPATAAPAGVAEALGADAVAVVRYALGGPVDRDLLHAARARGTRGWWVAASRSRAPHDADPELAAAGITGTGADRPVTVAVRLEHRHVADDAERTLAVDGRPTLPGIRTDEPTALRAPDEERALQHPLPVCEAPGRSDAVVPWWPWWASAYPHDAERFAVDAALVLARVGVHDATHRAAGPILDALGDHPGHAGPISAVAVSLGLAWRPADVRARAATALASMLAGSRLTVRHLIDAMVLTAPWVKTARWAAALGVVAGTGPSSRVSVVEILTGLLPRLDPGTHGLTALVDRLSEEAARADRPVTDPDFVTWATGLGGTSRATRTARLLARGLLDPTVT